MLTTIIQSSKQLAQRLPASSIVRYSQQYAPRIVAHEVAGRAMATGAAKQSVIRSWSYPVTRYANVQTHALKPNVYKVDHELLRSFNDTRRMMATYVDEADVWELKWPADHRMVIESSKGHHLTYQMCDLSKEKEADRISDIYKAAIEEFQGQPDYHWLHDPEEIREKVASGKYSIWGVYDEGQHEQLVGVVAAEKLDDGHTIHIICGAIDPHAQGRGVWDTMDEFIQSMVEKAGANCETKAVLVNAEYW